MQLKTLLRPALAAANQYEVYIPWHEDGLQGAYYDQYIDSYIKFLGLQNDSEHFSPYERSTMIESIKPQLDFTSDGYTVAKRSSTFW
ncbi:hypothetical protein ACQZEU_12535, partial [Corynebacterium diphtheriae]